MRIAAFFHSCVLIAKARGSLLFDAGRFSFVE